MHAHACAAIHLNDSEVNLRANTESDVELGMVVEAAEVLLPQARRQHGFARKDLVLLHANTKAGVHAKTRHLQHDQRVGLGRVRTCMISNSC